MKSTASASNLDILRSIAVLSVFGSHLGYAVGKLKQLPFGMDIGPFGRAGVLIFFVHTSLVLMMSMERMRVTGWPLFAQFYMRRFFRIYPLSILLCVVVSLCAIPRGLFAASFVWSPRMFLANVLLVQNITHSGLLSSPLWSLPYEIQMYLVLPILFMLMATRHWWISFAIALGAACFAGRHLELAQFAPCFLVGVLAFKVLPLIRRPPLAWWLWPGAVVALLLWYDVFHPSSNGLNKEWALCAAIAVLIPLFQDCHGIPALVAKLIARYSYGIYLCHLPLMWIFYRKLSVVGTTPLAIRHLGFAVSVSILPVLCYHLLEYPFIKVGVNLSQHFGDRATATTRGAGASAAHCGR